MKLSREEVEETVRDLQELFGVDNKHDLLMRKKLRVLREMALRATPVTAPAVSVPRVAEDLLADAGVFKGHEGLRGLANAREFWEQQPYGTRLYYGDGNFDYLHHSVLAAAIRILDKLAAHAGQEHEEEGR